MSESCRVDATNLPVRLRGLFVAVTIADALGEDDALTRCRPRERA
jgi:hypothetical protein